MPGLLPTRQLLNGYRQLTDSRRTTSFMKIGLFILLLFAFTSLLLYIGGSRDLESAKPIVEEAAQASRLVSDIDKIDDYDAACSGYSIGAIIREQRRVLASVTKELVDSQAKLDEFRKVYDELQRLIPQRQLELSTIEGEIEAALRSLQELRIKRNVHVYLPHQPLYPDNNDRTKSDVKLDNALSSVASLDDFIDYSRCSISSFMPMLVETAGEGDFKGWVDAFHAAAGQQIVTNPEHACIFITVTNSTLFGNETFLRGHNQLIVNLNVHPLPINVRAIFAQSRVESARRVVDFAVSTDVDDYDENDWVHFPMLLPYTRENLLTLLIDPKGLTSIDADQLASDVQRLLDSTRGSEDVVKIVDCRMADQSARCNPRSAERSSLFRTSMFCALLDTPSLIGHINDALRSGCIPIVLSTAAVLPFEDLIDWRQLAYRIPWARFPELHFIVRSFAMEDVLEMRRRGRAAYTAFLGDRRAVARSIVAALRHRLQIPAFYETSSALTKAQPLFNTSFTPPVGLPVNSQTHFDDESLGPLELPISSPTFIHNFTSLQMYAYDSWNSDFTPWRSNQHVLRSADPPSETEFYSDSSIGFRPLEPGSGVEFARALGGNRQREQFTVVLLTYERDEVLNGSLERLHQMPYLNKVVVVWNSVKRKPPDAWPSLHVPIEFIKVEENSLNNRFVPWDRIETEAVLSLDDDIDLMQQEIILAFRVWRENRERIVGFPARYHARYNDAMYYNSNHTCQLSIVLTGAAFLHKTYLEAYTQHMPAAIRQHVDEVKNCEDIAMNFLVAHLTRRPPIKTTSRWTLKCPTCTESLWMSESHFAERHECIRLFTRIYGYNPLKSRSSGLATVQKWFVPRPNVYRFSQFRADSILFKTRLPSNHQKCFKYV